MTTDYYRAERDRDGNIRLNNGLGLLVATARNSRGDIQGWRNRAANPKFIAQYDAALELFDREKHAEQ